MVIRPVRERPRTEKHRHECLFYSGTHVTQLQSFPLNA